MYKRRTPCTSKKRKSKPKIKTKKKTKRNCGPCSRHPARTRKVLPFQQTLPRPPPQLDFTAFTFGDVKPEYGTIPSAPPIELPLPLPLPPPFEPTAPPLEFSSKPKRKQKHVRFDSTPKIIQVSPHIQAVVPVRPPRPIRPSRPQPMYPTFRPKLEPIPEGVEVQDTKQEIDWKIGEPVKTVQIPLDTVPPLRFHPPPALLRKLAKRPSKSTKESEIKLPPIIQPKLQPEIKIEHIERTEPIHIPIETVDRRSCELKFHDYKKRKKLGEGTFGEVFELCRNMKIAGASHCPYVLKAQFIAATHEGLRLFAQEVRIQIMVHEKLGFTPAVYDVWYCGADRQTRARRLTGFIVMERMDGDLVSYLEQYAKRLTNDFIRNLMQTIRRYLTQLHKLGITHNDVADRNIFFKRVQGGGLIKWVLADWGFARTDRSTRRDFQMLRDLEDQLWSIKQRGKYVPGRVVSPFEL